MNIFYISPSQIYNGVAELNGQEAIHASKVMRAKVGDALTLVDGRGGHYEGIISRITKKMVQIEIKNKKQILPVVPELILGMGIIKKRDRLEFAVEKAVELGVSQICLFRSEHSIKENVRMDRLESIALSAMKQSLGAWLPEISFYHSLKEVLDAFPEVLCLAAHEKVDSNNKIKPQAIKDEDRLLLLVGPEGGFSTSEIETLCAKEAHLISLGSKRLRAETASVVLLSQFLS